MCFILSQSANIRIYHGGDLNWWHWEGEADSFNKDQETGYKGEIAYSVPLKIFFA